MATITRVLETNEPNHRGAWRKQSVSHHVMHSMAHLECWADSRDPEDLAHALTRAAMAVELVLAREKGDRR